MVGTAVKDAMAERTRSGSGRGRAATARSGLRVMTVLVSVLALVAAAGIVLSGAFGWQLYQHHRQTSARADAVAAAKRTCVSLMSVSADTVDRDIKRTLDGATGDFASQYKAGRTKLKKATVENKVKAKGSVLEAAVTSLKVDKSATVLLVMDARIVNVDSPKGRKAHFRVRATMAYQHDRWLVSKVEFVP